MNQPVKTGNSLAQDRLLHRAGLDLALPHTDRIAFTMKSHDQV